MSSDLPTPEHSAGALSPPATTPRPPHRVLACVLCAQRKVKCDRRFPCTNCTKASAQCMPAALAPRQRRRRFPERELLDRLRHYEDLLTKNNILFEPLHASDPDQASPQADVGSHDTSRAGTRRANPEEASITTNIPDYQAKNFWHAMNRRAQNSDNDDNEDGSDDDEKATDYSHPAPYVLRQRELRKVWDQLFDSNDHLLFCSRNTSVQLLALHPSQVNIFKLWQIYLENVDPLLKVTHTPTLQARIIEAAGDVSNISPPLEALMFSVYCMAVFSLSQEECHNLFGTPRQDILRGYQLGAREALLNCGFLRSSDRDCLTALHLYLVSVKPDTDPRSLSSMLGAAIRIAQRMAIHSEAANAKLPVLEAELRRRLWWSLVLFDARISEMTEFNTSMLIPTWDCNLPLNVNDFQLRSEMKNPPTVCAQPSEALFAVIRSSFADFTRHSSFHLEFIHPILKSVAKRTSSGPISDADELTALEDMFENHYIRVCDSDNPLHFMTIWSARGYVAKARFVHHISSCPQAVGQQTDAQRDAGLIHARTMLECDTRLMESPLIRGYRWLIYLHFPFPAYVHLVQDLIKRPLGEHAEKAWQAMSNNVSARFMDMDNKDNVMEKRDNPFFRIFAVMILQAWTAREAASGQAEIPPSIVLKIRQRVAHMEAKSQSRAAALQNPSASGSESNDPLSSEPMQFGSFASLYNIDGTGSIETNSGPFSAAQAPVAFDGNHWGWPAANWNSMIGHGW